MLNILFWNLHGKSIEKIIAECLIENDISMAAFSEFNGIDFQKLEKSLFKQYHLVQSLYVDPSQTQGNIHTRLIVKNSIEATAIRALLFYLHLYINKFIGHSIYEKCKNI